MPQLRDGEERVKAAHITMPRVMSANVNPGFVLGHKRLMKSETATSFTYTLQDKVDKTNNLKRDGLKDFVEKALALHDGVLLPTVSPTPKPLASH
eukprot:1004333-Prymnesium_polylepis.2